MDKINKDHLFVLQEIGKPITMTEDEIKGDYARIYRNFPINYIPHVDEGSRIVDNIHNFR